MDYQRYAVKVEVTVYVDDLSETRAKAQALEEVEDALSDACIDFAFPETSFCRLTAAE